ncbi:MAG TPA: SPOR domain-containing protein [Fibrobacteria bacterium]|nr:SPOR domain-containing protein [Fibrobacteria bacterium]
MHRSIPASLAFGLTLLAVGCSKKEEPPAVIEEAPAAVNPVETDTSATLSEEPNLQAVGGKAKTAKRAPTATPAAGAPSAEAAGLSDRGSYVVQVSVFKSARQAAGLVEKLAAQGFPAYVAEVENPTAELSGTYHRVRIGRFQKLADAKAFGEGTLRPAGYDFWVDNKKNDAVGGGGSYSSGESNSPSSSSFSTPPSAPVEEIRAPAEPATPASNTWDTPTEPAAPASNTWDTPTEPVAPASSTGDMPKSDNPAPAADTGKVNLDEW